MCYASRVYVHLSNIIQGATCPDIKRAAELVEHNVKISVSNKMTKVAGEAGIIKYNGLVIPSTMTMKLSIPLLDRCDEEQQDMIMLHEIAHLLDFMLRGTSDHDYKWKALCLAIGGDGKTFHSINREGLERVVSRFVWRNKQTGKDVMVKVGTHKRLTGSFYCGYEFIKEIKYKGREIVAVYPAQMA
jgi:predicted SprT family Zn-dependent metalloprotease